jgi:hypothetical protein
MNALLALLGGVLGLWSNALFNALAAGVCVAGALNLRRRLRETETRK